MIKNYTFNQSNESDANCKDCGNKQNRSVRNIMAYSNALHVSKLKNGNCIYNSMN